MTDIEGERSRLAAQGLKIIHRETWGARQNYTSDRSVQWPAHYLFLHITVTSAPAWTQASESAACRAVEAIGQQRFGIGWSYNAGAMQSGRLYEGQPLTRRGAHTVNDEANPNFPSGSLNEEARALALVQNVNDVVTDAQIGVAARWGAALRRSGEARRDARWFGHRDVAPKSCPGDIGYARIPELQRLTDHYTANGLEDAMTPEDWKRIEKMFADLTRQVVGNKPLIVALDDVEPGQPDHWYSMPGQTRSEVTQDEAQQAVAQGNARWWNPDQPGPLRVPRPTLEQVTLIEDPVAPAPEPPPFQE